MPRNPTSEARKHRIASRLESRLGPLEHWHRNRSDWYSSRDGKVDVFITDSKAHYARRPWFDMKTSDVEELANHPAGFIIFVLGEIDNFLVIPALHLKTELKNYAVGRRHANRGFFHLNLSAGKPTFEQLPNWSLVQYREKMDLIPKVSN
jgi:hypothetical protein